MKVSVTDPQGNAVPSARVTIIWESGGSSESHTNASGEAKFGGDGGIFSSINVFDKHVKGRGKIDYRTDVSVIYRR